MGKPKNEFPMLEALGLYAAPTTGYGNCLFAALSDQLYGDESHHLEIRSRVVKFMRLNGAYFKPFTPVNVGGGERRNSRRSTAGRYTTTFDFHEPTEDEVNHQFELKLTNLAQSGTYGDHMAIMAFSGAYGVEVRVHQAKSACENVSADGLGLEGTEIASDTHVAHIAFHSHEHYSSVRQINNQHQGLVAPPPTKATAEDNDAGTSTQPPPKATFEVDDDGASCSSPSGSDQSASVSSAEDDVTQPASQTRWPRYKVHERRKYKRAQRKAAKAARRAGTAEGGSVPSLNDLHI